MALNARGSSVGTSGRRDVSTSCDASWEDTWLSASAASGLTNLISSCWWHIEMACFAGCSPRLTRSTYTLISKTCPTLRSQLLCSSWCHLNLVPAGLSGVDKTFPPSPLVSHTKTHTQKKNGAAAMKMDCPAGDTSSLSAEATVEH